MVNRYLDCDEDLVSVFMEVLEDRFVMYGNLKFKLVFDSKKRVSKGKIKLASIEVANDKLKYFSKDDVAIEGYDYVIIIDRNAWDLATDTSKRKLISHELRHVLIDENDKCKIVDHDISDFAMEVKLNQDDPEWCFKLSRLVTDVYDQEKEMLKANKGS
jgi:hypothetical protein